MKDLVFQLHTRFNYIDLKYCHLCMDNKQKLMDLCGKETGWDILSHSESENKTFFDLNSLIQEYGYISIVFRHISIEGFINDIAIRYIDKDKFDVESDKTRFVDKIEKVYNLVSNKPFPRDKTIYQNLQDLNSVRNTLVHMKSGKICLDDLFDSTVKVNDKFNSLINQIIGNKKSKVSKQKDYLKVVEETKSLYDDLGLLFYEEIPKGN